MQTVPGTVLGTTAYMSPEQIRGLGTDARSDIFSFGAILYEMLAGHRASQGKTTADTMSSILNEEPPELVASGTTSIAPAIDRTVHRSLEENRQDRFQSAQDLGFALDAVGGCSASAPHVETLTRTGITKRGLWAAIATAVLIGVAFVIGNYTGSLQKVSAPSCQPLTFGRGLIHSARFTPDERTILYSAAWNGDRSRVFITQSDRLESSPLGAS